MTAALANCPARYVFSSADWALSMIEPGRAIATVYWRPRPCGAADETDSALTGWSDGSSYKNYDVYMFLLLVCACVQRTTMAYHMFDL